MTLTAHGVANPGQGLTMLHHPGIDGRPVPFPSRGDTMCLRSLQQGDVLKGPQKAVREDTQALRTHDIAGARPTYPHTRLYVGGPLEKGPIPGNVARPLYPELHRVADLSMTTEDIPRAQPREERFRTGRVVDPLTPRYNLPSWREQPVDPPKARMHDGSMRDSMEFRGQWTARTLERSYARDPNDVRDIAGTQASSRCRTLALTSRESLRVVEKAGERILSTARHTARTVHPLDPCYDVSTGTTHPLLRSEGSVPYAPAKAGKVEGSTPRVLHRDHEEAQASSRREIEGSVPQRYKGVRPFSIYDPPQVTPYSTHGGLQCEDIEGAQPGTRKAGTWSALGS